MRDDHPEFEAAGATIAVVVVDELDAVQRHWRDNGLPFIGIADPAEVVSGRYGQQWKLFKLGRMPAQFVLDCEGRIVFSHYGSGMSDIPENRQMLQIIDTLPPCDASAAGASSNSATALPRN